MRRLFIFARLSVAALSSLVACGGKPANDASGSGGHGGYGGYGVTSSSSSSAGASGIGGNATGGSSVTSNGGSTPGGSGAGSAPAGSGGAGGRGSTGATSTGGLGGATGGGGADAGRTVLPCGSLPAAGTWQNISPPAFASPTNMETLAVVVDPSDGSVYAAAGNKTNGGNGGTGVYKSTDCGATFTLVSTGTNSDKLASGDPWAMLVAPDHPGTLYINNGYGNDPTIFRSTNGGVDWTELNPDPPHVTGSGAPFVQAIAMDPHDSAHLAVTFHTNCGSPYNAWCFSESSDSGATWHMFNGPVSVPGFTISGWTEASSISILGASAYLVLSPAGVHYTGDGGATWTLVLAYIDSTSYAGSTHILPDGTLYIGNSEGPIYQSASAPGHDPPFAIYQAPSLPVPMPRLPFDSGLSPAVTALQGAPTVTQIIDDGVNLFASNCYPQGSSFYRSTLANPTVWTQMPDSICANGVCRGSNEMAYDSAHHVAYSANWAAGLWRLVTR